jgi:hypothetical protein
MTDYPAAEEVRTTREFECGGLWLIIGKTNGGGFWMIEGIEGESGYRNADDVATNLNYADSEPPKMVSLHYCAAVAAAEWEAAGHPKGT